MNIIYCILVDSLSLLRRPEWVITSAIFDGLGKAMDFGTLAFGVGLLGWVDDFPWSKLTMNVLIAPVTIRRIQRGRKVMDSYAMADQFETFSMVPSLNMKLIRANCLQVQQINPHSEPPGLKGPIHSGVSLHASSWRNRCKASGCSLMVREL